MSHRSEASSRIVLITSVVALVFAYPLLLLSRVLASPGTAPPPTKSTPAELVDALHTAFGEHHARAVHTKGIFLEGSFEPDPQPPS
jgi:catalase